MVVGILGILKSGGVYVPLDPIYPNDRLSYILQEIQAPVILCQRRLEYRIPKNKSKVIFIDEDITNELDDLCEDHEITGQNLAYIIFTSGSTGQPKGVMSTHQGLLNRLIWMQDEFRLREDHRVLQKTPFFF